MHDKSTILVPVDFSQFSRAAAERALLLARASHARLQLIHALHLPRIALDYDSDGPDWSVLRASEAEKLEQMRRDVEGRGVTIETSFEDGDPARIIQRASSSPDVEMIVMGSHGARGLDRLLLGSVSDRTLHNAPVPVVVVREGPKKAATPIETILFATDFSESARRAEELVARWALRLDADVEVLHVLFDTTVLFAPYAVPDTRIFDESLLASANRRTEAVVERLCERKVRAKGQVACGFASEEILLRAETKNVDLIAMGTRGHSGFQKFRLGSVVQRILRDAPCSVLVARRAIDDETS